MVALALVIVTAGPAAACVFAALPDELPRDPDGGGDDRARSPEAAALTLLGGVARAARETPYAGVQFVSSWRHGGTRTLVLDVEHAPGRGTLMTVMGTAADPGTRVYEDGDLPTRAAGLRGMSDTVLRLLARNYSLAPVGDGSVVGRSASIVEASRSDGSVAARFWVDDESGLMLRRQLFDTTGRAVQVSAYIDLRLSEAELDGHLPPAMPNPWDERLSRHELASMRSSGWTVPEELPDGLMLVEARKKDTPRGPVVHLGYSDGLSMVSLFVERGQLDTDEFGAWDRAELAGNTVYVRGGVRQRLVWAGSEHVYTLVADAPRETVRATVTSLPHDDRRGFWHRVARGLNRIGSWLNPFG